MSPEIEKVIQHIEKEKLLEGGESLLLSVSAGKDSMAMLYVLNSLKEKYSLSLGLFHLNHMMRGGESLKDEEFIRAIAVKYSLPLHLEQYDFSPRDKRGISFEERARNVRYGLLEKIAEAEGYSRIATAHNRDDNAETVLMRILEGTGLHGLKGIAGKRGIIIRPLLPLGAGEIYRFLEEHGIPWREDESNRENGYQRNYLRNRIIPEISPRFSRYRESLERLGSLASEHLSLLDRLIEEQVGEVITFAEGEWILRAEKVEDDRALFKFLLAKVLQGIPGFYAGYSVIEEILKKYYHGGSHRTLYESGPLRVIKTLRDSEGIVTFSTGIKVSTPVGEWAYSEKLDLQKTMVIDIVEAGIKIELFPVDYLYFIEKKTDRDHIFVTFDKPGISFIIRNRREGDRIKLKFGTKKIKNFFIEKKLDNEMKNCVPLLIVENEITAIMSGFVTDSDNCIADSRLVTEEKQYILAIRKC